MIFCCFSTWIRQESALDKFGGQPHTFNEKGVPQDTYCWGMLWASTRPVWKKNEGNPIEVVCEDPRGYPRIFLSKSSGVCQRFRKEFVRNAVGFNKTCLEKTRGIL